MQLSCLSSKARRVGAAATGLVLSLVLAACSSSSSSSQPPAAGSSSTGSAAASQTVWLCRPGQALDPCATTFKATSVAATGTRSVVPAAPKRTSGVDCFYVYPTVSTEETTNADLKIQKAEIQAAFAQASPFSSVCRVWAPIYRQVTASGLTSGAAIRPGPTAIAYNSLLAGWRDYLAHDNDGRKIVFIAHSQGSAMLIRLLESQVDPNPTLRAQTLMAIIAGGNVTVPIGKTVGATFTHLPLCTTATPTGCVIAYSTFPDQPPADSLFGRPGQGVSLQSGQTERSGVQVACVNPVGYSTGTASLTPYFPSAEEVLSGGPLDTLWVTYPKLYTASCMSANGATWLQVGTHDAGGRPVVTESLGALWGYHRDDINLALGNLVRDVAVAESARG